MSRSAHKPGPVERAVEADLAELPEELQHSSTAALARALAQSVDIGSETYRFQAALSAQIRECVTELQEKAPRKVEGDRVDDLNARRAARRRAASAG